MEIFLLGITVFGFVLNAESQSYQQIANPDFIYYNREDYSKQTNPIQKPSTELQPPILQPNASQLSIDSEKDKPINNAINSNTDTEDTHIRGRNKVKLDQTATALTNFSLILMKNLMDERSSNTVMSPYSISALISLLQQGATDQALQQISLALQMSSQASAAAYKAQNQDFQNRNSRNVLRTANNIFVADAFSINPEFGTIAQKEFQSDVTRVAFANTNQAAKLINGWVAYITNNKVDKIITPDSLSINTQMVLVNAIYFKGLWETPFRPQMTKPDVFKTSGGPKTVPFMSATRMFRAGFDRGTGSKVIILPFERQEYSLMIIHPSSLINVHDTFQMLTVSKLESYLNLGPLEVRLLVPKFSIRADTDLTPILKKMGISKIFEESSDLSGIGTYQSHSPQVTSAVHSAVLSIDEEGGSAAAVTAFSAVALSNDGPSLVIKVDRPFIAIIWDGTTKVPLFMAKIEDPSV